MSGRPILITGSHRSGSTWVGTILGQSEEVCYIFEPFNKDFGPGVTRKVFDVWYPYVCAENEKGYSEAIGELVAFKFHLFHELAAVRTKWQLRECVQNFFNFRKANKKGLRPLFKDPIALFSADWLAQRYDFQVVILIRHPAAFASSLKRLNWKFPFKDLPAQPLLVDGPLRDYKEQIADYAEKPRDIVDQSILLWNMMYDRVRQYMGKYKDWIFLRHEDLSLNPAAEYAKMFAKLGLTFTPHIETAIATMSSSENPGESPKGKATMLKRDSKENIYNWKKRLSPEEIERIRKGTAAVAASFYAETEW